MKYDLHKENFHFVEDKRKKHSHADGKASVFVGHVNPPEAGWHLRLLAKLEVVGGDDFKFFEWQQS